MSADICCFDMETGRIEINFQKAQLNKKRYIGYSFVSIKPHAKRLMQRIVSLRTSCLLSPSSCFGCMIFPFHFEKPDTHRCAQGRSISAAFL